MELGQLAALEGSLFDSLLALLDRLKGDMMGRLLDWTMRELKEKAKPYSQNRSQPEAGCLHLLSSGGTKGPRVRHLVVFLGPPMWPRPLCISRL